MVTEDQNNASVELDSNVVWTRPSLVHLQPVITYRLGQKTAHGNCQESLTTPMATFLKIFNGLLFGWTKLEPCS